MNRTPTGLKDEDGNMIFTGDRLISSYGIPPCRIEGVVKGDKNGNFFVLTPGHTPKKTKITNFIRYLGEVWVKPIKSP